MDDVPVTVLSGALGAGKTTTVNHLLTHVGGRDVAVLVNDMGAVNVDADLVESREDGVAELSNGCICCDLRDDLEVEVSRLAREREFEHLVVESSGVSEPAPVARQFTTGAAAAPYDLDALATVVNAETFLDTVTDGSEVETADVRRTRRGQAERETETRPLSDLLVGQVECADVLVLNKCDLADEATLSTTERLLDSLNPEARLRRAVEGAVDPETLLDTGLFDPETTSETAAWRRAAEHAADHDHGHGDDAEAHDHSPQTEYGIDSFVVRARRPVDPTAFGDFVRDLSPATVRSKGTLWVAGRDHAFEYGQAGPSARVERGEPWVATMSERRREMQRRMNPDMPWDDEHGDRRTELVFIGRDQDETAVHEAFETRLVAPGTTLETDPFPTDEEPYALR